MKTLISPAGSSPHPISPWLHFITIPLLMGLAGGDPTLAQGREETEIVVQTRAEPSEISIGDLVRVIIEVKHAPHLVLSLPEQPGSLGSFEVRSVEELDPTTTAARVTSRWNLTVSTFETGPQTFPGVELIVTGSSAGPFTLTTDSVQLEVQSVLPDEAEDILDIKSPLDVPRAWWAYWPWLVVGLLPGLLAWWFWRRRKRGVTGSGAGRHLLPPEEEALAALRALEASGLLRGEQVKPFYTKLSEILRHYLWRRFGIVALEATTPEIVLQLSETGAGALSGPANSILQDCDLVKFARLKPPREKGLTAIGDARNLVEKGRPQEPEKTGESNF